MRHSSWLTCCPLHLLAWLSQAEQLKAKAPAAIIGVKARQVSSGPAALGLLCRRLAAPHGLFYSCYAAGGRQELHSGWHKGQSGWHMGWLRLQSILSSWELPIAPCHVQVFDSRGNPTVEAEVKTHK